MWKKESGSKGEIHLTGTGERFVSWGFLFCARTSVMQVSTLLPSFKLLRTGVFLLLLEWSEDSPKDTSERTLSKTDRPESLYGSCEWWAWSNAEGSQEPENGGNWATHAGRWENKASQILSRRLSPAASKRQHTARKNHDTVENSGYIL